MNRAIAVLRPEPGNRVTAAAIEGRGARAIRLPLFAVRAVAWKAPDPTAFDALILTSANAIRHGGEGLARLLLLPVFAVGDATAQAARQAGFTVRIVGTAGADALIDETRAMGARHALHLAGRERTLAAGGIVAQIATVYASDPVPISAAALEELRGSVALVQSARAGARLNALVGESLRATIAIVAISEKAARAAGSGWEQVASSPSADAATLIETAIRLAD